MSLLVVGLSATAPRPSRPARARRASTRRRARQAAARRRRRGRARRRGVVSRTCNRVEVYADVDRSTAASTGICELLAPAPGVPVEELTAHLYVHYEDRAVQHLFRGLRAGLDGGRRGPDPRPGARRALQAAEDDGTPAGRCASSSSRRCGSASGPTPRPASTGRPSLVSVGARAGASRRPSGDQLVTGRDVLVVGAGVDERAGRGHRCAGRRGADRRGQPHPRPGRAARGRAGGVVAAISRTCLPTSCAGADLVISCTGAAGRGHHRPMVGAALDQRPAGAPLVLLDLALPRDVDPAVADLPGVSVVDLDELRRHRRRRPSARLSVAAVRAIVERGGRRLRVRGAVPPRWRRPWWRCAPGPATVVDAELDAARRAARRARLSGHALEEIAQTVRRVVDKLLHAPTVRVKELGVVARRRSIRGRAAGSFSTWTRVRLRQ